MTDTTVNNDLLDLAVMQTAPIAGTQQAALDWLALQCQQAAEQGASLVVLPEAWLSGYDQPHDAMVQAAEPADGPLARAIGALCQRWSIAMAYGYVERHAGHFYNAVQVIGSTGLPLAHYRKSHLWGELDQRLFSPGERLCEPFDLNGWRVGLLICFDVEFPETARALALQGAELVLVPTALMAPWSLVVDTMVPVRAAESQVFLAYANQCGRERQTRYLGRSCIVAPSGEVLARAGTDPGLIHATLHRQALTDARRELPYLGNRRPELYTALTDPDLALPDLTDPELNDSSLADRTA